MTDLGKTIQWKALVRHAGAMRDHTLSELFKRKPSRAKLFTKTLGGYTIDFSKNQITEETMKLLLEFAEARQLPEQIGAMMTGVRINTTEDRSVLHTALRSTSTVPLVIGDMDVRPMVKRELMHMAKFAEDVRSGHWKGYTGKAVTDVINIGIGGSDLGVQMAYESLKAYSDRNIRCHFVSNVDGNHLSETLRTCTAETTLFVIASKTFSTDETITNAKSAKAWCIKSLGSADAVKHHFVALTTEMQKASEFGISADRCFGFWDWVGGRYSLPSANGLTLMIAIGPAQFKEFLSGYELVDRHFATTPLAENIPVLLGLIDVWYASFLGYPTRAILPYEQYLHRLPAYLQQLIMESNGKCVTKDGDPVSYETSPIVWGEPGTNGQHSFHQLLHQGTRCIPADFILYAKSRDPFPTQHDKLAANCFAQAEALAFGTIDTTLSREGVSKALLPHKRMPGNRPSTTMLGDELNPATLGQLIALYEHRTFVQGVLWGINSFDQFGVELGKKLASKIYGELSASSSTNGGHDSSTSELIRTYRMLRK